MNVETVYHVNKHVLPAALGLLPGKLDTLEARAMLLAIGLQESEFAARVQGGGGPAHGYWQFEKMGGVKAVLTNAGTLAMLAPALHVLNYKPDIAEIYAAISHNDILACCVARVYLWTSPGALPSMTQEDKGWHQYVTTWRPGKPHPQTWPRNFTEAWRVLLHE